MVVFLKARLDGITRFKNGGLKRLSARRIVDERGPYHIANFHLRRIVAGCLFVVWLFTCQLDLYKVQTKDSAGSYTWVIYASTQLVLKT